MTLTQLLIIRKYLERVVVRGPEEDELFHVIAALDNLINRATAA